MATFAAPIQTYSTNSLTFDKKSNVLHGIPIKFIVTNDQIQNLRVSSVVHLVQTSTISV